MIIKASKVSNSAFIKSIFYFFILSALTIKVFNNLTLLLLSAIGLILWVKKDLNPFKDKNLRLLSILFISYFFVIMASILLTDGFSSELKHLGRKIHFFLAPVIISSISYAEIEFDDFIKFCKLGLIATIIPVSIESFNSYTSDFRFETTSFSGMFNSNIFGDMVVVMIFISLVKIYEEKSKELWLTLLAVTIGISILVLSGSRGSYFSFGILAFLFLIFTYKHIYKSYVFSKKKFLIVFLMLISLIAAVSPIIEKKYTMTINNLNYWSSDKHNYSSSGIRLEMWNSALEAHKDAPWHGYGYRNENKVVSEYSDYHPEDINKFTHLHNEYLTNLLSAGYIGLISVLSIILIPLYIFLKTRHSPKAYYFSLAGINLCLAYTCFGITHIAFGEENINALYIFLMSYLLPNAIKNYTNE